MHASQAAEADSTLDIRPVAPWRVAKADAGAGFRLSVSFMDGLSGIIDLRDWLHSSRIDGTIFEPLRDEAFFRQVRVDLGAVTWPNGADLSPDAMYDAIRRDGCWAPN